MRPRCGFSSSCWLFWGKEEEGPDEVGRKEEESPCGKEEDEKEADNCPREGSLPLNWRHEGKFARMQTS